MTVGRYSDDRLARITVAAAGDAFTRTARRLKNHSIVGVMVKKKWKIMVRTSGVLDFARLNGIEKRTQTFAK